MDLIVFSIILGSLGTLAGTILYMQKHYIGRDEKELDDIESSFYNLVKCKLVSVNDETVSGEIDKINALLDLKYWFKATRKNIHKLKDTILIHWLVLILGLTLIIFILGNLDETSKLYSDSIMSLAVIYVVVFLLLIDHINRYRKELNDLNEHINNVKEELNRK
ncbi:hypothetical protein BEH94_09395 [Candidatus Altiarchaeales archaeon WOR_SM1_SCG]|nr:hypothetical protein BEH94_09395 [Candidatus Altiarchaeales archaeon WOR_SM1_SCG]